MREHIPLNASQNLKPARQSSALHLFGTVIAHHPGRLDFSPSHHEACQKLRGNGVRVSERTEQQTSPKCSPGSPIRMARMFELTLYSCRIFLASRFRPAMCFLTMESPEGNCDREGDILKVALYPHIAAQGILSRAVRRILSTVLRGSVGRVTGCQGSAVRVDPKIERGALT